MFCPADVLSSDESDADTDFDQEELEPVVHASLDDLNSACDSSCCVGSELSQPFDKLFLKRTERTYGSGKHLRKRRFLTSWYKTFPWLHLCRSTCKAFCYYCRAACKSHVTVMSTKADPAFSLPGFSNWKKAVDKFKEHEQSLAHRDSILASTAAKNLSVSVRLQNELNEIQTQRRKSFMKQLMCLLYLLRQGLAVRNDHAGGSNLTVMLEHVLGEEKWVNDGKYQSPEIINEIIAILGHKILCSLISDIQQHWFSLLADETRDISNNEQLVICLRWVSDSYDIAEDMVGLVRLDNTTAQTVYLCLKDCLLRLGVEFQYCRGQAYDGARSFQGHVSGVAKKFQADNAAAVSVHCLAHCVNLSIQEVVRNVKSLKEALNFAMDAIQLIKYSPKRQVIFETIQAQQDSSSTSGIKTLCPTRWTVRTGAMSAIVNNYEVLHNTFEEASEGTDECSRRANGAVALMDRFAMYFGLKLSILIFGMVEQLSITLQGKSVSVQDGFQAAEVCIRALNRLRSDEKFRVFYNKVKEDAADRCDPPVLPRQKQLPRRIDEGIAQHVFTAVEQYYRREYFQALDEVKGDLERRFQQKNFLFVRSIEELLLNCANGRAFSLPEDFVTLYQKDIDMAKLTIHLQMLQDAIKSTPLDGILIREVTSIQTICDVFNAEPTFKKLLTEVHKLLKIYLTIPVTTSTAEQSFSALKRIKTYLRNSMSQQRLNNCMLVHVLRQKADNIHLEEIAKEFVGRNDRRQNFFGHF